MASASSAGVRVVNVSIASSSGLSFRVVRDCRSDRRQPLGSWTLYPTGLTYVWPNAGEVDGATDDVALGAVDALAEGIAVAVAVGEAACCPPRSPRITATSAKPAIAATAAKATTRPHGLGRSGTFTDATCRLSASVIK